MKIKWVRVGALVLTILATIGGVSVVGLLQSTEKVGTGGTIIQSLPAPPPLPPSPPPEPTVEIDVYGDSGCTQEMTAIDWGKVEVGKSVKEKMYIKNNGDQIVTISLIVTNWVPSEAAGYMELSWDYDGSSLEPQDVIEVTFTLSVDPSITGIDDFGFDIVIIGSAP